MLWAAQQSTAEEQPRAVSLHTRDIRHMFDAGARAQ